MRVMMMLKADRKTEAGGLPTREHLAAMGKLMEDMAKAGVLLAAEGLQPSSKGKRVKFSGGTITSVTDGPFTEAKELIAGFCMIQATSWEEVMEWGRRFAVSLNVDTPAEADRIYNALAENADRLACGTSLRQNGKRRFGCAMARSR